MGSQPSRRALWEHEEDLRSALRPVPADVGETAQFLAAKSLVLNNGARWLFLSLSLQGPCRRSEAAHRLRGGRLQPRQVSRALCAKDPRKRLLGILRSVWGRVWDNRLRG